MKSLRRWLVAHDFSPSADSAARVAARDLLDGNQPGEIVLLHVYQVMPLPTGFDGAGPGAGIITLERAVAVESSRRLERVAESLRADIEGMRRERPNAPSIHIEVNVRQDAPAEGIIAVTKEREAERIIVGTHGRTGLSHFLLGSVAERVMRLAHVPVLVVKGESP